MNIQPSTSPVKMTDYQKKQCEKIFARCFDVPQGGGQATVNQEGINLCTEAGVNPDDLLPKSLDWFKKQNNVDEVAKIRYQHHVQKRLRKLSAIGKIIEQLAIKRRMDAEQAEQDYQKKTDGANPMGNIDLMKQEFDSTSPHRRTQSSHIVGQLGSLLNTGVYRAKIDEIKASPVSKKQQAILTNKIIFYQAKKNQLQSGFSATSKFRNRSSAQSHYATTPGSFFHARHQRNNSLSQRTDGHVLGSPTYQTNFMATVAQSVPISSKSFRNYLSTREKKVEIDKDHIDKMNEKAFKKIKNEKLAEKSAKDRKMEVIHKQGKIMEKFAKCKNTVNVNNQEVERESQTAFKVHIKSTEERIKRKVKELQDAAKQDFQRSYGDPEFKYRQSLEGNDILAKSQMNKTQPNMVWPPRGRSLDGIYDEQMYKQHVDKLEERMNKGFGNSLIFKQQIHSRYKQVQATKRQADSIYKEQDDKTFAKWSASVMRDKAKAASMQKQQKDKKAEMSHKQQKITDKFTHVKVNIKDNAQNFKEKQEKWLDKYNLIDGKVKERDDKVDIFTKKHKQINELRFQDLSENQELIYDQNFKKNCKIDEKHLALSLMNQDRKMFLQNHNDRFRSKLARESGDFFQSPTGSNNFYALLQLQHQNPASYAPDMVKLSKAQIAKLMKEKKSDD